MRTGVTRSVGGWFGVAFGVLGVAGYATAPGAPAHGASGQQILAFYTRHAPAARTADLLLALAFSALLVFGWHLSVVLRPPIDSLGRLVLAGATVLTAGAASYFGFDFVLAGSPGNVSASAVQALNALALDAYLPVAVGALLFGVAAGVALIRSDQLPRWTGYVAVVLGLVAASPAGILGLAGFFVWGVVLGAVSLRRLGREAAPAGPSGHFETGLVGPPQGPQAARP